MAGLVAQSVATLNPALSILVRKYAIKDFVNLARFKLKPAASVAKPIRKCHAMSKLTQNGLKTPTLGRLRIGSLDVLTARPLVVGATTAECTNASRFAIPRRSQLRTAPIPLTFFYTVPAGRLPWKTFWTILDRLARTTFHLATRNAARSSLADTIALRTATLANVPIVTNESALTVVAVASPKIPYVLATGTASRKYGARGCARLSRIVVDIVAEIIAALLSQWLRIES